MKTRFIFQSRLKTPHTPKHVNSCQAPSCYADNLVVLPGKLAALTIRRSISSRTSFSRLPWISPSPSCLRMSLFPSSAFLTPVLFLHLVLLLSTLFSTSIIFIRLMRPGVSPHVKLSPIFGTWLRLFHSPLLEPCFYTNVTSEGSRRTVNSSAHQWRQPLTPLRHCKYGHYWIFVLKILFPV